MLTTQLSFFIPGLETMFFMALILGILLSLSGLILQIELFIVEIFYGLFRKFITFETNSSTGAIIQVLKEPAIQKFLLAIFLVALILLILSTIVKVITLEFNFNKDGNNKSATLKAACKAIAMFVVVPIVSVFGLIIANLLLGVILNALENVLDIPSFVELFNSWGTSNGILNGLGSVILVFIPINLVGTLISLGLAMPLVKKMAGLSVGYIQRIFELVALFMISAPIIALIPINEAPYKSWRDKFIKGVLGLFGTIISVNICLFLTQLLSMNRYIYDYFQVAGWAWWYHYFVLMAGIGLIDSFASLFAGLIGGNEYGKSGTDLYNSGMQGAKNALDSFKKVTAIGATAISAGMAAQRGHKAMQEEKRRQADANKDDIAAEEKKYQDAQTAYNNAKSAGDRSGMKQAKKDMAAAKARKRDLRNRIGLTKKQEGLMNDLQMAANKGEWDSASDIVKDLRASGMDTATLSNAIKEQNSTNLNTEANDIRAHGTRVSKFRGGTALAGIQADNAAKLESVTKKLEGNQQVVSKGTETLSDLHKKYEGDTFDGRLTDDAFNARLTFADANISSAQTEYNDALTAFQTAPLEKQAEAQRNLGNAQVKLDKANNSRKEIETDFKTVQKTVADVQKASSGVQTQRKEIAKRQRFARQTNGAISRPSAAYKIIKGISSIAGITGAFGGIDPLDAIDTGMSEYEKNIQTLINGSDGKKK